MSDLLESSHAPWRRAALPAAIVVGLSIAAWCVWPTEQEPGSSAPTSVQPTTVFGPGLWTGSTQDSLSEQATHDYGLTPPSGLAVSENGDLIVNAALHEVIDFFLLEQADEQSAQALQQYLKNKLPPSAYEQAMHIVAGYRDYMQEHDALLAAQNLNASDLQRIADWRTQRDRLRQRLLGDKVVQAWYQNDDSQLDQALDELQQRREAANGITAQAPQPDAAPRRPVPHWKDPAEEQKHIQYQQSLVDKAATSYADQTRAGRQWANHYAAYLNAVNEIGNVTPSERSRRVQELLMKFFPTEAERQHARDRGA